MTTSTAPNTSGEEPRAARSLQGAMFGVIVASIEMHAAYVTTGRFDLGVLLALIVYYTAAFAILGLVVGMVGPLLEQRPAASSSRSLPTVLAVNLSLFLMARCGAEGLYSVFRGDFGGIAFLALAVCLPSLAAGAALFLAGRSALLGATVGLGGHLVAAAAATAAICYAAVGWRWATASANRGLPHFGLLLVACLLASMVALVVFHRPPAGARGLALAVCLLALVVARSLWGPAAASRILDAKSPDRTPLARINVLLVVLDTLRADHLDLYGYHRPTMPRLAELARGGEVYEDVVASSSWTLPSHGSLFTGRSPREHGARGSWAGARQPGRRGSRPLDPSIPTLAETLRAAGYRTEGVVANSLYLTPRYGLHRGFDYWDARPSFQGAAAEGYSPLLLQVRSAVDATPLRWIYEPLVVLDVAQLAYRRAAEINNAVLDRLGALQSEDRPFFLFVNYMDPHDPYLAPGRFADRFPGRLRAEPRFWQGLSYRRSELDPEALREHLISQYDSVLAYLDHHLLELFRRLEADGVLEDTLVIVTSDHGEAFLEHGQYQHGKSLYQEEIAVPLVVRHPGDDGPARRVRGPIDQKALMPWLLHRLGLALPEGLTPVERLEDARPIVAELAGVRGLGFLAEEDAHHDLTMVREGSLKYLESTSGASHLYDLGSDPAERAPFAEDDPAWSRLAARLAAWEASHPKPAIAEGLDLTPDEIEQLRSLGYID